MLQARWAFVYGPATTWDPWILREVVTARVMRNMVVEDDGDDLGNVDFDRSGRLENILLDDLVDPFWIHYGNQ